MLAGLTLLKLRERDGRQVERTEPRLGADDLNEAAGAPPPTR